MKLDAKIAQGIYAGGSRDGWEYVTDIDGENRRWSYTNEVIVKAPDGKLYAFEIEYGLTEEQPNEFPWGDRWDKNPPAEIDVYEVEAVEVTTIWYRQKQL